MDDMSSRVPEVIDVTVDDDRVLRSRLAGRGLGGNPHSQLPERNPSHLTPAIAGMLSTANRIKNCERRHSLSRKAFTPFCRVLERRCAMRAS
jgi:hypothetical protein